ncbi:MAG: hypothetical protein IKW35_04450 [Paludibacteraceae bacterium]|nr:hypothetical protein [Paludibacteraceae bacterium]
MEQYADVQQLMKEEDGKNRKLIYPPTVIQAVFDGKTGASLEAILAQFNSVYVQYQGTPKDTRLIIPMEMRRAGLTITYMDMESNTITERANSAVQKDNDHWGLDVNWSRIDELSLSGDISVSAKGTWIINGVDTEIKAVGPKGDAGLTPWLKTIDNKLHFSYDNVTWEPCSENIAAWFRWSGNKIQISRDNKTWTDLSGKFADNVHIKGYVANYASLPSGAVQGDVYGVGPTYAAEDTAHTNPIYRYYVRNANTWVDNGSFTSLSAGVVQETGNSETEVMSQKAVTEELSKLASEVGSKDSGLGTISEYLGIGKNITLRGVVDGFVSTDGTFNASKGSYKTSDFISVSEGKSYLISSNGSAKMLCVSGYATTSQDSYLPSFSYKGKDRLNVYNINIPSGVNYIRVSFTVNEELSNIGIIELKEGTDIVKSLKGVSNSIFAQNKDNVSLDDVIVNSYTRRQIYSSIRDVKFYNCDKNEKRTIYVLWNGYNGKFSFRISKYSKDTSTWDVEFELTEDMSNINPTKTKIVNITIEKEGKIVSALVDTSLIANLTDAFILNKLSDEPDFIFADSCYDNPSISESKKTLERLVSSTYKVNSVNGYVSKTGEFVSGAPYKTTDFIEVSELDSFTFGISGSTSTLGYSEYADNTQQSIILETSIMNNNGYQRLAKTIGKGVKYIRITYNEQGYEGDYSIIRGGEVVKLETRIERIENNLFETILNNFNWNIGFVKVDGSLSVLNSGNYYYSDFIEVKPNEVYSIGMSGSKSTIGLSMYSEKEQSSIVLDSSVINNDGYQRLDVTIPKGINYIRVVYNVTLVSENENIDIVRKGSEEVLQRQIDNIKNKEPYDNYSQYLIKHGFISPKIACVSFQMDCNAYVVNGGVKEFCEKLDAIGCKATFFPLSSDFTKSGYVELMQWLQNNGHEVSVHTVPSDGIGTNISPHPTEEEFHNIVKGYVRAFVSKGLYPIGWVTSQGEMVDDYFPLIPNYVGYAHTLGNGAPSIHEPNDYVNTKDTNKYKILRWGIEQLHDNSNGLTDEDVVNKAKQAIDYAISVQGHVHLYCHSYNLYDETSYTLRESVLTDILAYVKSKMDEGLLVVGTTAEVCNYYYNRGV